MSYEDWVYMIILFAAIPFGHLVKLCGSASSKKLLTCFTGFFVVYMTVGLNGACHSFVTILGTYFILCVLGSRYGPWTAFIYVFSYLFFFRTCHWYGFAKVPPYSNAIQLLVTLRMCTIAFEGFQIKCDEPRKPSKQDNRPVDEPQCLKINIYDMFAYGYCYCGLLTGPYYRFTTYVDMLHQKNSEKIPTVMPALERLKYLPLFAAIYIPLNANFPTSYLTTPEYMNHEWGFIHHFGYLIPMFYWFKLRFYIGWILAEASCITMCLGAYPKECKSKPGLGPSVEITDSNSDTINENVQYDFNTIHNINIYAVEFTPNMSATMRNWNMSVQWWLAAYVHRKLPFKKYRMPVVLLVSAFWHGVKPGYYLTFMTTPLLVFAELRMDYIFQPSSSKRFRNIFDWVNWFCLYRVYEYLAVSFVLLDIAPIFKVWSKMYYCMHVFLVFVVVVSFIVPRRDVRRDKTVVKCNPSDTKDKTN